MQIKVLLVEDSKIQKLANERILHKAGYIVLNAADGEEALRLAREKIPDIVLLDMLLPKLGGREVMRALRADPPTAMIPVLGWLFLVPWLVPPSRQRGGIPLLRDQTVLDRVAEIAGRLGIRPPVVRVIVQACSSIRRLPFALVATLITTWSVDDGYRTDK